MMPCFLENNLLPPLIPPPDRPPRLRTTVLDDPPNESFSHRTRRMGVSMANQWLINMNVYLMFIRGVCVCVCSA